MSLQKTITFDSSSEKFIISIDKNAIEKDVLVKLIDNLRTELLAKNVDFGNDIEEIGEIIKAKWWETNKSRIISDKDK